ncbi:MAG: DNA-protecting protein DprA, partial [Bacteroidota bacterium]
MSELKFKIAISLLPGIGCILARRLVSYCGSIESVFLEKKNNLKKIPGIGEFLASRISNQQVLDIAEREVEFIHKNNIQPIFYLDAGFPFRLKQCEDGPVMLYAKGNVNFDHPRIISV